MNTEPLYDVRCPQCMNAREDDATFCTHCGFNFDNVHHIPAPLPPGELLAGRYELGVPMGRTSFGVLFAAWDRKREARCGVSECLPLAKLANAGAARDLARSFQGGSPSAGDAWFTVDDLVEENGLGYFAVPYDDAKEIAGARSLREFLERREQPLSAAEALQRFGPLLDAVETLHGANRVHGALAPDTVFLRADGRLAAFDFGPAGAQIGGASDARLGLLTGSGAPEQRGGKPDAPATDVYLLGATLFHAVSGQAPDQGRDADSARATLSALPDAPPGFREAIVKSLSERPGDRFRSVAEFQQALTSAPVSKTQFNSRPWILAAMLLLIVGGVAAAAWYLWPQPPHKQEPVMESERAAPPDPVVPPPEPIQQRAEPPVKKATPYSARSTGESEVVVIGGGGAPTVKPQVREPEPVKKEIERVVKKPDPDPDAREKALRDLYGGDPAKAKGADSSQEALEKLRGVK